MPEQTTLKDWLPVVTALIVAIPAALGWLQSRKNAVVNEQIIADVGSVKSDVAVVHDALNGQTEKLIKVEKAVSKAEGVIEGHEQGVAESQNAEPLKVELVKAPVPVKVVEK